MKSVLRNYGSTLVLLVAISGGAIMGVLAPSVVEFVRPVGEFFLNLIYMILVPLVFFTVASSIASVGTTGRFSGLIVRTLAVFIVMSGLAAIGALLFMLIFRPIPTGVVALRTAELPPVSSVLEDIVKGFTVADFNELLSKKNILPLVVFSVAFGLATAQLREKTKGVVRLLDAGAAICVQLVKYVMYLAPVGLGAFFAVTVVDTGAHLASVYVRVFASYYTFAAIYFVCGFSACAYIAGRGNAMRYFWGNVLQPSLTALGTCSSLATMPISLEVAPAMRIPPSVRDLVIPIGTVLHKDGSVIGGVAKILFLFSVYQQSLTVGRLVAVVGIGILVGVVMGAIPSGGLIGEMLILSVFGFPPEALPLIAVITVLIDPAATLINVVDDLASAMLVTRWTHGDMWSESEGVSTEST